MSNNKSSMKNKKIKTSKEKYNLFNDFLSNLERNKSLGYSLELKYETNFLSSNKINPSKYIKFDGSKTFLLNSINSIVLKDDLNKNLDISKTLMDNLEFITSNSKYIYNLQNQQSFFPRIYKNNELLPISSFFIPQKNLFNINKKIENIDTNINNNIISNENNNKNLESDEDLKEINDKRKKETSNKSGNLDIKPKKTISFLYRQDYYIKQFKVQYSLWLRNYLNQKLKLLINEIKSCRKHLKFYPLNSLKFTANTKYEDNKLFLSLKIKEILIVGIDGVKSSNQKKNKENIEIIENNLYKHNENANPDLLNFLNSTMEDSIQIFYHSEHFQKFKDSDQAKLNDLKFEQEKKFSLLKENGFIYLIKNYKGNSKSGISFASI